MNAEIQIQWTDPLVRAGARAARRVAVCSAVALLSSAGIGCLAASSESDALRASDPQPPGPQIEQLRRAIDRDHATLEDLITRPRAAGGAPLHDDPELRAIAARLTDQERELERLKEAAEVER